MKQERKSKVRKENRLEENIVLDIIIFYVHTVQLNVTGTSHTEHLMFLSADTDRN